MVVDKVGRSTGWTRGEVTATCVSRDHGYAVKVCQIRADYHSAGGDSGSPVFFKLPGDNVALVGIHHSASASGNDRYFSTLDGIEYDLGITLDVIGDSYTYPVSASIGGPDMVPPDYQCAWQAIGSGGTSPFEYKWWGALSGSSQTIWGSLSEPATLWLEVKDFLDEVDTAQVFIEVDEELEECEL